MVYSVTTYTTPQTTYFNQDKFMMITNGVGRRYNAAPQWRGNNTISNLTWTVGSDISESTREGHIAVDGKAQEFTRPVNQTVYRYAILMDLTEDATPRGDISCIAFLGHNFGSLYANVVGGGATSVEVRVDIADNNAFTTNLLTIATFSITSSSNNRIANFNLGGTFNVYQNVRWLRIIISVIGGAPPNLTLMPIIGEVILGGWRIFSQNPFEPYDPDAAQSVWADWVARGGGRVRFIDYSKQSVIKASWQLLQNDRAVMDAVYEDSNGFGESVIIVRNPSTAPNNFLLGWVQESVMMKPFIEYEETEAAFSFVEEPPFLRAQT